MKNKKILIRPRLPSEAIVLLRTKGGPQSEKRGMRGYDRQRAKNEIRECLKKIIPTFF